MIVFIYENHQHIQKYFFKSLDPDSDQRQQQEGWILVLTKMGGGSVYNTRFLKNLKINDLILDFLFLHISRYRDQEVKKPHPSGRFHQSVNQPCLPEKGILTQY